MNPKFSISLSFSTAALLLWITLLVLIISFVYYQFMRDKYGGKVCSLWFEISIWPFRRHWIQYTISRLKRLVMQMDQNETPCKPAHEQSTVILVV